MSIALTMVLFLARDEEEQQNRLHEHGLAIVSITEGILQHEPENEGALELHEWFSLSTKGKFRGHTDLQEYEHKVRHPRDDDEQDDDGDEQDDQGDDDQYDEHGGYDHYNEYGGYGGDEDGQENYTS
jgi:hypothetical protein